MHIFKRKEFARWQGKENLHGFPKSGKANVTGDERKALQFAGKVFLELSGRALSKALYSGVLMEVHCEQDH